MDRLRINLLKYKDRMTKDVTDIQVKIVSIIPGMLNKVRQERFTFVGDVIGCVQKSETPSHGFLFKFPDK